MQQKENYESVPELITTIIELSTRIQSASSKPPAFFIFSGILSPELIEIAELSRQLKDAQELLQQMAKSEGVSRELPLPLRTRAEELAVPLTSSKQIMTTMSTEMVMVIFAAGVLGFSLSAYMFTEAQTIFLMGIVGSLGWLVSGTISLYQARKKGHK